MQRRFGELVLEDDGIQTPDGTIRLGALTRAEVVRHREHHTDQAHEGASTAGVVGGAVVGGMIAGPIGAVGGGLLGSTIKEEHPGATDPVARTTSATLILESRDLEYSMSVTRERAADAEAFAAAVREAAGL